MSSNYSEWVAAKGKSSEFGGLDYAPSPALYPHQQDLVRWALARGRAAIFADTGLGKTRMQVEWARTVATVGRVLIVAPLAVAEQTAREAASIGVDLGYRRADDGSRIVITNYDMIDHFDASEFAGVVLDESSILKSFNGATRTMLIAFKGRLTPEKTAFLKAQEAETDAEIARLEEELWDLRRFRQRVRNRLRKVRAVEAATAAARDPLGILGVKPPSPAVPLLGRV